MIEGTAKHHIDNLLAECDTVAIAMTAELGDNLHTAQMTRGGLRTAVRTHWPWLRYNDDISLTMGMLAMKLRAQGWTVILEDEA